MRTELFDSFRDIANKQAGIHLLPGKETLVQARVARRVRALGLDRPTEYLRVLKRKGSGELVHFLDAISTNFTSFYREQEHFDLLSAVVGRRLKAGQRRFRFWSAACSSGEEPYSMAMTIEDAAAGRDVDYRILATDISTRVLDVAKAGVYPLQRLGKLTRGQRARYLLEAGPKSAEEEPTLRFKGELRKQLAFKRLNLSRPPFPMPGPLDMVFCRNVMIYFDTSVRQGLLTEIERLLRPGGLLVIGHSETLAGITTGLRVLRPSIYVKPESGR